ncbi:hypothetical protein CLAFUW4_13412 [Fulvia fulva]|uniref:2EXR domain-containing protein n=1 Tax=Passalora fulva TaxID=5499 RepID=A0A9Q8PJ89_PASFU|nr:uncharacterized protein CLAFUR5_13265 [Fulvia fulva]KAK4612199.1 hypothetical protein CLAFUR4_13415 [Fulvia fulva]KAK4612547.1 hypothetical protein CLAFUR0_13422 [Fulvia fulva]UJO23654.1 hypothetical protein CLAFUR5_13265 [Fulvia fulva]WPV21220.1 hypothetical protein CLAFUW4_13412 [Fulvia fulva]WPV36300.1 hypothetical protein CLAFUW7_13419 [Fulvia fulva]
MQVCSTFKLCPCAGVGVVLTFELIVYASPSLGYYQHQVNITVIAYFHTMAPVLPISDASAPSSPRTGFFDLSAELRNRIYSHLLEDTREINLWHARGAMDSPARIRRNPHHRRYLSVHPQILSTCKQIHNEATPMLYGSNRFSVFEPSDAVKFFVQIRGSVQYIRHLGVEIEAPFRLGIPFAQDDFVALFGRLESAEALVTLTLPGSIRAGFSSAKLAKLLGGMYRSRAEWMGREYDAAELARMVKFETKVEYFKNRKHVWRGEDEKAQRFGRRVHDRIIKIGG